MGRRHICRLACLSSSFSLVSLFFNHDFGGAEPHGRFPVPLVPRARGFVRQITICGTKTHLANIKIGVYPLSEHLHPLSAGIQMGFESQACKASEFPPYFYILFVLLEMLSEYSLHIARDCRPSFAYSANDKV